VFFANKKHHFIVISINITTIFKLFVYPKFGANSQLLGKTEFWGFGQAG